MARLLTNGAETQVPLTGTAGNDGQGESFVATNTVTIATATPRSGAACFSCGPSAINTVSRASLTTTLGRTYYLRAGIRFSATPNGNMDVLQFRAAGLLAGLRITTAGKLQLVDSAATVGAASSAVLSANTWYVLELSINVPASGSGTMDYRLDGVPAAQGPQTSANIGNLALTSIRAGHALAADTAATVLVDDIALNDDQGSSQNSWPGLGKVIHLKPISDSAVGTGWLEADGTTGSLYDNVDNEPPTGVAATPTTGATQIKNASNGGPFNYDASTQTYTTGGIDADDIVVLTRAIMRLSGSSTTGTNDGFGQVVSNPADAGATTWTAAFDVVAGAEPTGWASWVTPYVYSPSVTLGTSPVIRVTKNTAATRVHMAALMVLEVEYTVQATATGAAAIAGAGTISASGTRTRLGAADIAGAGTVAATASHLALAAAAIAGAGTVAATGVRTRLGAANIAGTGAISATGTVISGTVTGEAAIAGAGSISATATHTAYAAASVAGTGTVSASGTRKRFGAAAIAGIGTVSATGTRIRLASGAIAGTGTISASGRRTRLGAAAIAGTGTISASGGILIGGAAAIAGTGAISATGTRVLVGTVHLAGAGTISATGTRKRLAVGRIAGAGTISATAFHLALASAVISGTGQITASGLRNPWRPHSDTRWPEDDGDPWTSDNGDPWPALVGAAWVQDTDDDWS